MKCVEKSKGFISALKEWKRAFEVGRKTRWSGEGGV